MVHRAGHNEMPQATASVQGKHLFPTSTYENLDLLHVRTRRANVLQDVCESLAVGVSPSSVDGVWAEHLDIQNGDSRREEPHDLSTALELASAGAT